MERARHPLLSAACRLTPARLAAVLLTATPTLAAPPAAPSPAASPDPPRSLPASLLDQEIWAGISYDDALAGLAILGGGAAVVALATGSTATALTVAAAVAATFIAYDPGPPPPVTTPSEALPELAQPPGKN